MLLATSEDKTASIWNVSSDTTWSSTPHVTLRGHTTDVRGGAFLKDDLVVTASFDESLRVWRASDGVQTAEYRSEVVRHSYIYLYHSPMLICRRSHCLIMLRQDTLHLSCLVADWKCGKQPLSLLLKLPCPTTRASASGWRRRRHKSRLLKHHLQRQMMDYGSRCHVNRN